MLKRSVKCSSVTRKSTITYTTNFVAICRCFLRFVIITSPVARSVNLNISLHAVLSFCIAIGLSFVDYRKVGLHRVDSWAPDTTGTAYPTCEWGGS